MPESEPVAEPGTAKAESPGSGSAGSAKQGSGDEDSRHWIRLIAAWAVLSAILDPVFYFLVGPHIPPGTMTNTAAGAQFDFNVLFVMGLPVVIGVWLYLGYAVVMWRASRGGPEPVAGPYARGHLGIQVGWIAVSTALVLALFVFGTYELVQPGGAGGGEGPNPIWTPSSHTVLPIQVIAQQWKFTYRYPTYGGFETNQLEIPADTSIAFHVTSLDVIHDFWAYQLGVKADANPDADNVAFTTTTNQLGSFTVRCDELCGIWHGAMFNYGTVVTKATFQTWAQTTETDLAANTKLLPAFAWTYVPDANSADGGFYPDNVDPYSGIETYGAQKVSP
jgi:cytochrome c oxidase subunit 2